MKKVKKIGTFINGKVIITFPLNTTTDLKIGQKLESGQSVIAKIAS